MIPGALWAIINHDMLRRAAPPSPRGAGHFSIAGIIEYLSLAVEGAHFTLLIDPTSRKAGLNRA
jgi:hypothetical protein